MARKRPETPHTDRLRVLEARAQQEEQLVRVVQAGQTKLSPVALEMSAWKELDDYKRRYSDKIAAESNELAEYNRERLHRGAHHEELARLEAAGDRTNASLYIQANANALEYERRLRSSREARKAEQQQRREDEVSTVNRPIARKNLELARSDYYLGALHRQMNAGKLESERRAASPSAANDERDHLEDEFGTDAPDWLGGGPEAA